MNYCLVYGASETASNRRRLGDLVNYYLDYRTSETAKSKWIENHYGELLPGLPYLRNSVTPVISAAIGELLLGLPYFRNGIRSETG